MSYTLSNELDQAFNAIKKQYDVHADIALTLGSGLGFFADEINQTQVISYSEIPNFPQSTVEGHAGRLVFGEWEGKSLVIAQGRQHHYEGYSLDEVTFATRLFHRLGAHSLVVTNAAGCANPDYNPGEFMTITNHIPMVEKMLPDAYKTPTPSEVWDTESAATLRDMAEASDIVVRDGTYAWVTGPSYETPAEVQYLQARGADSIGMSTVPEAIAAAQLGMRVLGISCFTNYATGLSETELSHAEVSATAERVKSPFAQLVRLVLNYW
ncbi:MAG: purine-nucleoside phosphorylase [Candidatus Marinimicrobia bacterium]|nr:purine-nucleoside phosphorylase [Candidatus Neomarinimicrobiota bacterium]MCF7827724.1 purine-nucleoside phosphorylase [Candidatus Neomarinimicrobiota bacterium]MCF7881221.1 purine-nucleoside phosphorylase [Candidatus Neomarinimicrobiota bacterium]